MVSGHVVLLCAWARAVGAFGIVVSDAAFFLVEDRGAEARRLLPVAAAGITVDVLLTLAGVFDFGVATIVPLWLIVLWWVFAAAMYRSFAKIGQSLWLAAILGGVAAVQLYGRRRFRRGVTATRHDGQHGGAGRRMGRTAAYPLSHQSSNGPCAVSVAVWIPLLLCWVSSNTVADSLPASVSFESVGVPVSPVSVAISVSPADRMAQATDDAPQQEAPPLSIDDWPIVGKARLKVLFWNIYDSALYTPSGTWQGQGPTSYHCIIFATFPSIS